eukprot:m.478910 g.478910  ORF g.478910 m.478910 type:complete len:142 (-) comp21270_c0_seq1:262-687(-)
MSHELSSVFELYDESGDGYVSLQACGDILRVYGHNPSDQELRELVASIDSGSNRLSFSDVQAVVSKAGGAVDYAGQVREAFQMFDKDGRGAIDASELKHIMTNLGEKMTDEEVLEMFKLGGFDAKGSISKDDFIKICLQPV